MFYKLINLLWSIKKQLLLINGYTYVNVNSNKNDNNNNNNLRRG